MSGLLDAEAVAAAWRRCERELRRLLPTGEIERTGSASCADLPASDIDLVVLVDDVDAAAALLRGSLRPLYETEWRDDWAAFRDPGPPQVDVVLTRRGTAGDAHHRRAWHLLQSDAGLRAQYRALKADPVRYEERKAAFFDRVVAELAPLD